MDFQHKDKAIRRAIWWRLSKIEHALFHVFSKYLSASAVPGAVLGSNSEEDKLCPHKSCFPVTGTNREAKKYALMRLSDMDRQQGQRRKS